MDLNPYICSTLEPLGCPICEGINPNFSTPYIAFNYTDIRGVNYCDDTPQADRALIQVHLFVPDTQDYTPLKSRARALLHAAGFDYPAVEIFYEPENSLIHIVLETGIDTTTETEE